MDDRTRVTIDPAFEVRLPAGWVAEKDDDGGVSLSAPNGPGLLHLMAFPQSPDDLLDPAEELYEFLEGQGIELEEDEVEDVVLAEGQDLALCEYVVEEEVGADSDRLTYWLVGVATAPGNLVFCSYSCGAEEQEKERAEVRAILSSMRLSSPAREDGT